MILSKSNIFIDSACKFLDLNTQNLYAVDNFISSISKKDYVNKGHWLSLAQHLNSTYPFEIKQIFFLDNNPFLIFATSNSPDEKIHEVYNEIWNLAQPKFLFLESNGRLDVFNLTQPPVKLRDELRPFKTVSQIKDVLKILHSFNRESIETGKIWGDNQFTSENQSADNSLINDLKIVRSKFFASGLNNDKLKYAHALIGRAIFIRYLEDRKIIKLDYFQKVAAQKKKWIKILDTELAGVFYKENMGKLLFPRILCDHEFTYTFFKQLAEDFNGDIFPADKEEEIMVTQTHLTLLQNLLVGNIDEQKKIFLWAYNFEIIPLELISNIYEEFYHFENKVDPKTKQLKDSKGTHYTPISLVDFVLRKALPFEILKQRPRVIDPACGSGIFLVEAFRRMVRTELYLNKKQWLSWDELLTILQNQIFGIELNEDAIKISAFSLYLAFLNYQKPPDIEAKIKENKKLPMLLCTDNKQEEKLYFDSLLHANSFDDINNLFVSEKIKKNFQNNSFDVVIGNPPWGTPKADDIEGRKSLAIIEKWCKNNNKTISDKEPSQAFLWKTNELLKQNGISCLLVSSGVLLKNSPTAKKFRKEWLDSITLLEVNNFIHVRNIFFKKGVSPFLALQFKKNKPNPGSIISYWTAKHSNVIDNTQSIILNYSDFKTIEYSNITNDIWKILYFGNLKDNQLIELLKLNKPLEYFKKNIRSSNGKPVHQGFIEGKNEKNKNDYPWISQFKEFPADKFNKKYGTLNYNLTEPPVRLTRARVPELYTGKRILIKSSPKQKQKNDKGEFIVRLEEKNFSFRNTINCIKLKTEFSNKYEIILAILWSTFTRYFLFMTSSKWAVWHDQAYVEEIINLPIEVFTRDENVLKKIKGVVTTLKTIDYPPQDKKNDEVNLLSNPNRIPEQLFNKIIQLEYQLDEAVFDLYMLTESQRDLIRDRCKYDIDHFYKGTESIAVKPVELPKLSAGTLNSFSSKTKTELEEYIQLFLEGWENYMEYDEEFHWKYFLSAGKEMLAVVFNLEKKGENLNILQSKSQIDDWGSLLLELQELTKIKYSEKIYIEGSVFEVAADEIIIIKRNEKRLWTRSCARFDSESSIIKAVNLPINQ